MTPREIEKAMLAPASVFASPEQVLEDPELSSEQKIAVLLRWEYDAAEESVAVEEGMPGRDNDLVRRILVALGKLNAAVDVELSDIKENLAVPSAAEMLRELMSDHETAANTIRAALSTAQAAGDEATAGLLADRLAYHEKQLWMMRSMAPS